MSFAMASARRFWSQWAQPMPIFSNAEEKLWVPQRLNPRINIFWLDDTSGAFRLRPGLIFFASDILLYWLAPFNQVSSLTRGIDVSSQWRFRINFMDRWVVRLFHEQSFWRSWPLSLSWIPWQSWRQNTFGLDHCAAWWCFLSGFGPIASRPFCVLC